MSTPDPAVSLEEIKERYRTSFVTLPGFSTSPDTPWAHVNSADDVPVLAAAVEAALKRHRPVIRKQGRPAMCEWDNRRWPCPEVADITRELTGEGGTDGH